MCIPSPPGWKEKKKKIHVLPALLAALRPIGPAEADGCGIGDGFAIHPAKEVGRAAGVGWNGYKHTKWTSIQTPEAKKQSNSLKTRKTKQFPPKLTPCALMGGKAAAFGTAPNKGLVTGDGALAPLGCPQLWSTNKVFMSGFGLGFLQSWCCQFKLHSHFGKQSVENSEPNHEIVRQQKSITSKETSD